MKMSDLVQQKLFISSKKVSMDRKLLQDRTKQFHIDVIKLCEDLPRNVVGFETAKQIIRSAGSVGANYRAHSSGEVKS